jgi:hypothetical protein
MDDDPYIEVGERDIGNEAYGFPEPPKKDSLLIFTREEVLSDWLTNSA